jgi:ssRNA-specific RNase YbeY (16S rRNA maturation enzyme)
MISVLLTCESRYPVNRQALKKRVEAVLAAVGLDEVEVSLLIVGERKMRQLFLDFAKENRTGEVLAFPQNGPRGPDGILYLGDVAISYPAARQIAMEEGKMVDEVMGELGEHGIREILNPKP